ncbi:MAG: hypothetical protein RIQ93_693 [Verrucomicrobiota bacterium]
MAKGIMRERQRRPFRTRRDLHSFHSDQQERRPKQIDELRREKKRAKRHARGRFFPRQSRAKMSDKHSVVFEGSFL